MQSISIASNLGAVNSFGLGGGTLTPSVIDPQCAWAGRITVLILSVCPYLLPRNLPKGFAL